MAEFGSNFYEWQIPPMTRRDGTKTPEDRILSWLNESMQEGQTWLKNQRGYVDIRKSLDVLSGRSGSEILEYRSKLNTNRLKHNVRQVVGALSDIRPLWGYHSDNQAYQQQA